MRGLLSTSALVCAALAGAAPVAHAQEREADGEIIVTAQRREQSLQDVPLSVTALSGEELEERGINAITQVEGRLPGVSLHAISNGFNLQIRGVGNTAATVGGDGAASLNVDGVYRSRNFSTNATFFDVNRVELLRGPQGTLWGRNAITGALNVITNTPTDEREGSATLELGNFSLMRFGGYANIPLSDDLSVRIAGTTVARDGYLTNGDQDADDTGARIRALYEPSPTISLLATIDYSHKGGHGNGYVVLPTREAEDGTVTVNASATGFFSNPSTDPYFSQWSPANVDMTEHGVSLEYTQDFGWSTLTLIPSYREFDFLTTGVGSGSPLGAYQEEHLSQTTFEARLNSAATSTFDWVTGLYYYNETYDLAEIRAESLINPQPTSTTAFDRNRAPTRTTPETTSYAAFGQVTFPIFTDRLRGTLGLRYTHDEKSLEGYGWSYQYWSQSGVDVNVGPFDPAVPALAGAPTNVVAISQEETFNFLDWRAGLEFDLTPDSMVFAAVSTGHKAGGINPIVPPAPATSPTSFGPEELVEYTLGSRNEFLDGRLRANFTAFYWEYDGRHQVARATTGSAPPLPAPRTAFITFNLGGLEVYGGELDLQWAPTDNDVLALQVVYNHGLYADEAANTITTDLGVTNVRNQELSFQAPWQVVLGYEHIFELNDASWTVSYNGTWRDRHSVETGRRVFEDATFRHDLSLTYEPSAGDYQFGVWVRNVSDEATIGSAIAANTPPNPMIAVMEPPRTFGAFLSVDF